MDDLDDLLDDIEKSLNAEETKPNEVRPRKANSRYVLYAAVLYACLSQELQYI